MALPGHRHTSSSKRRRSSHFALKKQNLSACKKCGEQKLSHRACPECGHYGEEKSAKTSTSKA